MMGLFNNVITSVTIGMLAGGSMLIATDAPRWGVMAVALIIAVQMSCTFALNEVE